MLSERIAISHRSETDTMSSSTMKESVPVLNTREHESNREIAQGRGKECEEAFDEHCVRRASSVQLVLEGDVRDNSHHHHCDDELHHVIDCGFRHFSFFWCCTVTALSH